MCQEAGARVQTNVLLRDMNLDVPVTDGRQIEVVATGLPIWNGAQVAVDTTLVSPLSGLGEPRMASDRRQGIVCREAIRQKRVVKYFELLHARRSRLQVMALEVGGRWDDSALDFLRQLARAQARQEPLWLREAVAQGMAYRWSALLAVAAQRTFAISLLHGNLFSNGGGMGGEAMATSDLLAEARFFVDLPVSRLGPRG